jgi:hypothetical protein
VKEILINLLASRWTGLISHFINFTNENFTFKITKFAKSINVVLVVIIMLTCLTNKHCYSEKDKVHSVSSSISTILFVNYTESLKRKQIKSNTSSFVLSKSLSELDSYGYVYLLSTVVLLVAYLLRNHLKIN